MKEIKIETLKAIQETPRGLKLIFSCWSDPDTFIVIPKDKVFSLMLRLDELYKI